jgi:hypothetical protein
MEATPEPEQQTSTPIIVPQMEERPVEYFNGPFTQAPGLEALSTAATANFQYIRAHPAGASPGDAPPSSNNLNFILNPTGPEASLGMFHL